MKLFAIVALFISSLNANASNQDNIRSFSGCYQVSYQFTETLVKDSTYPIRSPFYSVGSLEWVELDSDSENHIALQHILITGEGIQKHWRQVWDYQTNAAWNFKGNNTWEKSALANSQGQWTQWVLNVDDSPRYGCSAPWIEWNDSKYWECQAWAPLPRREFTKRSDYQVLNRRNRQQLYAWGWQHEEDNTKLVLEGSDSRWIAKEKGYNTYVKVSDDQCMLGREWWAANKGIWHEIQGVWDEFYANETRLQFKAKVNSMTLWEELFELAETTADAKGWKAPELRAQARATIERFLVR